VAHESLTGKVVLKQKLGNSDFPQGYEAASPTENENLPSLLSIQ
jgi:hypothetical protein